MLFTSRIEPSAQFAKDYPSLDSFVVSTIRPVRDRDAFRQIVDPETTRLFATTSTSVAEFATT